MPQLVSKEASDVTALAKLVVIFFLAFSATTQQAAT